MLTESVPKKKRSRSDAALLASAIRELERELSSDSVTSKKQQNKSAVLHQRVSCDLLFSLKLLAQQMDMPVSELTRRILGHFVTSLGLLEKNK